VWKTAADDGYGGGSGKGKVCGWCYRFGKLLKVALAALCAM